MRNPPIPLEVCYPRGIPEGVNTYVFEHIELCWWSCESLICVNLVSACCSRRVNIDFSNLKKDQKYADRVWVDSANKTYWIER
jgi:hypothetical protein